MTPPAIHGICPSFAVGEGELVLSLGSSVIFQAEVRHGVAHARHVLTARKPTKSKCCRNAQEIYPTDFILIMNYKLQKET